MIDIVEQARVRAERAIAAYAEAIHMALKIRLREVQSLHFARHKVALLNVFGTAEIQVDGRRARELWMDRSWSPTWVGLRKLVEIEDWYDEVSENGTYEPEPIELEATR